MPICQAYVYILDNSGKLIHKISYKNEFTLPFKYEGILGNIINYYDVVIWDCNGDQCKITSNSILSKFSNKYGEYLSRSGLTRTKIPFAVNKEFKGEYNGARIPDLDVYVCIGFEAINKDDSGVVQFTRKELKTFMNTVYSLWNPSDGYDIQVRLKVCPPYGKPYDLIVDPDTIILLNL